MGLFKKNLQPETKPEPPQPEIKAETTTVTVNLTDKMMKVELEDDHAYLDRAEVRGMDDRIRLTSRGIVIAEITKRSKAYSELEPRIGQSAKDMAIEAKEGDYGAYFRVKLKFESTHITF